MNELVKHIEILLLSKDCVVVPDFGGFVAHHVCAHYKENDSLYYPPLRTIGFNPQLKLNDSLLVQSYVDAYEMSYPDALNLIENEVNEMRQRLENNGFLEMEGLGSFTMNKDGMPEFEPCLAGILTPNHYGLSSYEIVSLQQEAVAVADKQIHEVGQSIEPLAKKQSNASLINMSWVRNAAVACAVIFAFFMIPQLKVSQDNSTNNANSSLLSRVMPKDIVNGTPDLSSANLSQGISECSMGSINMASFINNTGKPNLMFVSSDSSKPYYSIILASHVTIENALEFVNQLHSLGYQEAKILSKGSTKVLYGQFDTKEEAYDVLIPLKNSDSNFTDAWVMKVEF